MSDLACHEEILEQFNGTRRFLRNTSVYGFLASGICLGSAAIINYFGGPEYSHAANNLACLGVAALSAPITALSIFYPLLSEREMFHQAEIARLGGDTSEYEMLSREARLLEII